MQALLSRVSSGAVVVVATLGVGRFVAGGNDPFVTGATTTDPSLVPDAVYAGISESILVNSTNTGFGYFHTRTSHTHFTDSSWHYQSSSQHDGCSTYHHVSTWTHLIDTSVYWPPFHPWFSPPICNPVVAEF